MKAILLVGIGGGIGSIMRHLTSILMSKHFPTAFPWGTFTVNILGCLLVGLFLGVLEKQEVVPTDLKLLLITGFCGGYTTFSAFSNENLQLLQNGNALLAFTYISVSVVLGIAGVLLGLWLAKAL